MVRWCSSGSLACILILSSSSRTIPPLPIANFVWATWLCFPFEPATVDQLRPKPVSFCSTRLLSERFIFRSDGQRRYHRRSNQILSSEYLLPELWYQSKGLTFVLLTYLSFQHDADRTMIYLTLYITECLRRLQKVRIDRTIEDSGRTTLPSSANPELKRRKSWLRWLFRPFPFPAMPTFHWTACSPNPLMTKLVRSSVTLS